MQSIKDKLLNILVHHIGKDNGLGVAALSRQLGVAARQVRRYVSELRQDGIAVCGTPRNGYYIARSADELEETCQFLRQRALHSLTLESRLRKLSLADLVGQLHLRT